MIPRLETIDEGKEIVRKGHCFNMRGSFNGAFDLGVVDGGYDGVRFGPVVGGEGGDGLVAG